MVYLILIISLCLNVGFIFKIKMLRKLINDLYCTDEELDHVLDRLWLYESNKKRFIYSNIYNKFIYYKYKHKSLWYFCF